VCVVCVCIKSGRGYIVPAQGDPVPCCLATNHKMRNLEHGPHHQDVATIRFRHRPYVRAFSGTLLCHLLLQMGMAQGANVDAADITQEPGSTAHQQYSSQFLTDVDQVLVDLAENAFWTEGQWYNMSTTWQGSQYNDLFSLYYAKPEIQLITDPTGVYDKKPRTKRDLPLLYQSAPPAVPCKSAASTSIISGGKAVDFAAFAIGILTLVININNNINNNNNNNNNLNFNAVDSSNIVANFNTNNANQVNVMPPGRKKRSVIGSTAVMILAAIKSAMDTAQRALPKSDVPKMDMRNASFVQKFVMEKMIQDPRSKLMAGCSDMKNCQQRLSFYI